MSEEDYTTMLQLIEDAADRLQSHLAEARAAEAKEDFVAAAKAFRKALEIIESPRPQTAGGEQAAIGQTEREYVRQRLGLNTYKSKRPDARTALEKGLEIMKVLNPDTSNDTETLGITGAIHKRLWQMKGEGLDAVSARTHLDKAVEHYGRGFNVKKDYYNGENYAVVLEMRAGVQQDPDEASYDLMTANKVRKEIVKLLQPVIAEPEFEDRPDKAWVYATLANCQFALGNELEAQSAETQFNKLAKLGWMLDTYVAGKTAVLAARKGR
jgi:tetratricopeptide (TPR) repeat protein